MDALSAGASLLAFLGLALNSAKAIHDVLSAVKDGPRNIKSLTNEVAQLQSILERLSHIQTGPANNADSIYLAGLVTRCATDVTSFESRLQRLDLSTDDRRIGRLWRRLKGIVNEKELEHIRDNIHAHMLALNLSLGILQTTHLSCSSTQSSEILDLLKQIKTDIAGLQKQSASTTDGTAALRNQGAAAIEGVGDDAPSTPAVDIGLDESITRLTKLVGEKECVVESDEAKRLIYDLQALLKSALNKESLSVQPHIPTDSHESQGDTNALSVLSELELANSLVLSAPSIAINSRGIAQTVVCQE
jgi:hypothetical protein